MRGTVKRRRGRGREGVAKIEMPFGSGSQKSLALPETTSVGAVSRSFSRARERDSSISGLRSLWGAVPISPFAIYPLLSWTVSAGAAAAEKRTSEEGANAILAGRRRRNDSLLASRSRQIGGNRGRRSNEPRGSRYISSRVRRRAVTVSNSLTLLPPLNNVCIA